MKAIVPRSVLALTALTSNEGQVRFGATTCVKVTASGGNFRAEATNGRLLGILNGYAEGECDMLIDAAKFAEIKKILRKEDDRIVFETRNEIGEDEEHGEYVRARHFTAGGIKPNFHPNGEITGLEPISKIGGEYHQADENGYRWPNTDGVIPSGKVACQFLIDPKMLIEVLRVAQSVANGEAIAVKFTVFRKPGRSEKELIDIPIAISCQNDAGSEYFDGIIVPLAKTT